MVHKKLAINSIIKHIQIKSYVVLVLEIMQYNPPIDLLNTLIEKNIKIIIVLNKCDTLPIDIDLIKTKINILSQLKNMHYLLNNLVI